MSGSRIRQCEVAVCKNTSENYEGSFFNLPNEPLRQQEWLQKLGTLKGIRKNKFICNQHFGMECFSDTFKRRLLKNAIPFAHASEKQSQKKKHSKSKSKGFPAKVAQREAWVKAIGRKDWFPTDCSRLCSDHFPEEMIDRSLSKPQLRANAVPIIFETDDFEKVKSRKLDDLKFSDGKFLGNFDPEKSARETRKMNRKSNAQNRATHVYDDKGIHIESGVDLCDCLEMKCPGCFFPCPKCLSSKCGVECRVNRKYTISHYDIEGTTITIKNPLL